MEFIDFFPGSFGFSKAALFGEANVRSVAFKFFPTLLGKAEQYIFSWSALSVSIDSRGHLLLKWNGAVVLTSSCRVVLRTWYSCHVRLTKNGELSVALVRLNDMYREIQKKSGDWCNYELSGKVFIASKRQPPQRTGFFNGKVEALEIQCSGKPIGLWDFSKGIDSFLIPAITGPDIKLQNSPTRGVCGSLWDGSEFNWRNKPSHYAVHFHEDDVMILDGKQVFHSDQRN